jgi:predicted ATPase
VIGEVREKLPDLPVPPALESQQARFRFFDSFTTFLKNAARNQPLLLILDDLHAADTPSLLLLQFLARELQDAHLLVIGTYRDVEMGPQHPLAQTLGELAREYHSHSLLLHGLNEQEVARFIELSAGFVPSETVVTAVQRQTEGNPFFVTEVVHLLASADDRSAVTNPQSAIPVVIPLRVREAIGRRLLELSEECRNLLTIAAVIGREFNLNVLEAVEGRVNLGRTGERLLARLDEAVAARLLIVVPQGVGRYVFSHALIRETLYQMLSTTQRVRLHRQVGEVLEHLYGAHLEPHLAELAYHFFLAAPGGEVDKAITYAVQAGGERATTLLAYEEAVGHYERALQVLELKGPDEVHRGELLLALGDAQQLAFEADRRL